MEKEDGSHYSCRGHQTGNLGSYRDMGIAIGTRCSGRSHNDLGKSL